MLTDRHIFIQVAIFGNRGGNFGAGINFYYFILVTFIL